jgi:predicted  nucleic acid-binding Zn-ribbon protein
MNLSASLHRLQILDNKMDQCLQQINRLEQQISDDSAVVSINKALNTEKNSLHLLEQELKMISFTTSSLRIKIEQCESSLYSGTINVPKELQDLQNEIASLKKQLGISEENELDLMFRVEKQQLVFDNLNTLSSSDHIRFQNIKDELNKKLVEYRKELEKIKTEREPAEKSIHPKDLVVYNRIRQHKAGIAVIDVIENTCSSCGAEISHAEWQKARISQELVFCQGCGRIIYGK